MRALNTLVSARCRIHDTPARPGQGRAREVQFMAATPSRRPAMAPPPRDFWISRRRPTVGARPAACIVGNPEARRSGRQAMQKRKSSQTGFLRQRDSRRGHPGLRDQRGP